MVCFVFTISKFGGKFCPGIKVIDRDLLRLLVLTLRLAYASILSFLRFLLDYIFSMIFFFNYYCFSFPVYIPKRYDYLLSSDRLRSRSLITFLLWLFSPFSLMIVSSYLSNFFWKLAVYFDSLWLSLSTLLSNLFLSLLISLTSCSSELFSLDC